jgi:DNA-binding CsgD family transcriptional regulator
MTPGPHQSDSDILDAMVDSIYAGIDEQPLWQTLLNQLCQTLTADISFLILRKPVPGDTGLLLSHGLPPHISQSPANIYSEGLYALDPFVNLPEGQVMSLDELIAGDSLQRSEFYQSCMKPYGIEHILGADLRLPEGLNASLRLTRSDEQGSFEPAQRALLQRLLPHLRRAIGLFARLQRIESERSLMEQTVSQLSLGSVLLDEQRNVLHSNRAAQNIALENPDILHLGEQLSIKVDHLAARFRQLLERAIAAHHSAETDVVQALSLGRSEQQLPLNLVLRPLPPGSSIDGQALPAVAVFISDPEYKSPAPVDVLQQLYGLTPAESRLATALADGLSLYAASEMLHISRNTARAHLRAIFAKTGVTQQTMLVSLLLKSVAAATAKLP